MHDLRFWFDPVCPFAWLTSTWVRDVCEQRSYSVEWRLISLRLLNADVDYDAAFPPEYEAGHTAGLRLLRVIARARAEHGPEVVGPLYEVLGRDIWDAPMVTGGVAARIDGGTLVGPALDTVGLPRGLAAALDDTSFDDELRDETEEALRLSGRDVGTPILQFGPPEGAAFFGPVISRQPSPERAVELWDHLVALARFEGFAELKRSLRERPQLAGLGVRPDEVGVTEDWHAGSRRLRR